MTFEPTQEAVQAEAQRIELRNAALRRLEQYILVEPRRFDMTTWVITKDSDKDKGYLRILEAQSPPCGTVGCLAGNAIVMDGEYKLRVPKYGDTVLAYRIKSKKYSDSWIPELAQEKLHLTDSECSRLFFIPQMGHAYRGKGWPAKFGKAYMAETDLQKKAEIAVDRIEHLIATGE
jgi:hypothetical protein